MRTNDNAIAGLILTVVVLVFLTAFLLVKAIQQHSLTRDLTSRVFELERIAKVQSRINDDLLAAMVNVGSISYEIFQRYTTPPERVEK